MQMKHRWKRARFEPRRARKGLTAVVASLVAVAAATVAIGSAGITTPTPDQVVRDAVVPITESVGGRYFGAATGETAMTTGQYVTCTLLLNPKRPARSIVSIRPASAAPTSTPIFQAVSPLTGTVSSIGGEDRGGAWSTKWDIPTGTPAGKYTITSIAENRRRVSALNPCALETVTLSTVTFEYRPWQFNFSDYLGGGSVSMNTIPAEFGFKVDGVGSPVVDGSTSMQFFSGSPQQVLGLPANPGACASDPAGCVPPGSTACNPVTCNERFVVINHNGGATNQLVGVFDLQTGAFAASAVSGSNRRVLFSPGTAISANLDALIDKVAVAAAARNVDLLSILASTVRVTVNGTQVDVSLLKGLTAISGVARPNGVNVLAPYTAGAGLLIHNYTYSSATNTDANGRPLGYQVRDSSYVPQTPGPAMTPTATTSPLIVDMGGPVRSVSGTWPVGTGSHVVGGLNVDTAPGEPNGLPVWLPVVSGGTSAKDTSIEFLGHAVVIKIPIPALQLHIGVLVGTGAAVYGSIAPVPVSLAGVPVVWNPAPPAIQTALRSVETQLLAVLGNSTVTSALETVLGPVLELAGGVPV